MTKVHLKLLPISSYIGVDREDPIRYYAAPGLGWYYRRRVEMCLEELTGGQRILEIGFGSGVSFFNLHELYTEIHGVDLRANIDEVAGFFRARGIETHLQQGDVRRLPYTDGFFDSVLMISILEHLQPADLHQAMAEAGRVLRPGGQLVYGAPVERRLMATAFGLLGTDIRSQHFSTEKDIAGQAAERFRALRIRPLRGPLGLFGTLYEVGHFVSD